MEIDKKSMEATKKEVKYRGVKAMPFIIGNETFEKLGTVGTSSNLLVYFTTVFNMSSISATNLLNIFNGSANFGTLLGAFFSDTYFGRYKTLGFACVASFLGMLVLTLTAIVPGLRPPRCAAAETANCRGPTLGQMTFLIGGLILLVTGAGGIRPCNLAFGADQFDPDTESGKRAITSFFNWYYFTLTFAVMISVTFVVYIQAQVNWGVGLGIPAFFMFLSCALFFMGTKIYVKVEPQGSPLVSVGRTVVVAFKKRNMQWPQESSVSLFDYVPHQSINSKLHHTDQFRCLDKAAIITEEDRFNPDGSAANPWKLCSIQQVEELKCLIRVLPIWVSGIIYNIAVVSMTNYAVFQALQSDRRLGRGKFKIPAASYSIFTNLTVTIWVPLYDRIVMPRLRKVTGKIDGITLLQKLGIGIVLMIITLIVNALVEYYRRIYALTMPTLGIEPQRGTISSLSGLWLVAPLTIAGLSEAFSMIALVEFYYKQFPENMRSIGGAFLFCGLAMSNYLSSLLQAVVVKISGGSNKMNWLAEDLNKGRLDLFYYLIAGLELINLVYFLVCAKWYRYRGSQCPGGMTEDKKSEIGLV